MAGAGDDPVHGDHRVKTALVVGGAAGVYDDLARYTGPADVIVAANLIGIELPRVDAWVSVHTKEARDWKAARAARGLPPAGLFVTHQPDLPRDMAEVDLLTPWQFPGAEDAPFGSSGLFAAKVALVDLGCDRAVLAGIPIEVGHHAMGDGGLSATEYVFSEAEAYRPGWLAVPEQYRARMRSLSGWTMALLGQP